MSCIVVFVTTTTVTETHIRRIRDLQNANSESARLCAQDAVKCLLQSTRIVGRERTPAAPEWVAAAERWIDRGASHEWGFALPEGW